VKVITAGGGAASKTENGYPDKRVTEGQTWTRQSSRTRNLWGGSKGVEKKKLPTVMSAREKENLDSKKNPKESVNKQSAETWETEPCKGRK